MVIAGIDEAGRGPVIGPMVISMAVIDEEYYPELLKLEPKDSKQLKSAKRQEIALAFKEIPTAETHTLMAWPHMIDRVLEGKILDIDNLNALEAHSMASLISVLLYPGAGASFVKIDSPGIPDNFMSQLFGYLVGQKLPEGFEFLCQNKLDEIEPIVSMASIIAKENREHFINKEKEKYGDFGSGYPSDPKTQAFIRVPGNRDLPIIRKSWKTIKNLEA